MAERRNDWTDLWPLGLLLLLGFGFGFGSGSGSGFAPPGYGPGNGPPTTMGPQLRVAYGGPTYRMDVGAGVDTASSGTIVPEIVAHYRAHGFNLAPIRVDENVSAGDVSALKGALQAAGIGGTVVYKGQVFDVWPSVATPMGWF
jgi:hypothetical protein